MKSDIHPNYHMIKVVMTNGVEFTTRSTYGEEGATLNLDIDPNTHPAWTGGSQQLLDRGGRLSRFNTRFGGIGLGGKNPVSSALSEGPRRPRPNGRSIERQLSILRGPLARAPQNEGGPHRPHGQSSNARDLAAPVGDDSLAGFL